MSQPKPPKPGKRLAGWNDRIEKIRAGYERSAFGDSNESEPLLEALLGDLEKESLNPDASKYLMDRFAEFAMNAQEKSDQLAHFSYMLAFTADKLQEQLVKRIQALSVEQYAGETFTARLKKGEPTVTINPKELPPDFLEEVKAPNQLKIYKTLEAGFDIQGVQKKDQYEVEFAVNKKVK